MISLSYTLTSTIQDNLLAIDQFRRSILTTPLSPLNEQKLRFNAVKELPYRDAVIMIQRDWTANPKPITVAALEAISGQSLRHEEADIKKLLAYLAAQKDHPVLLAGVAYGQLMGTDLGSSRSNGKIPRLVSHLILTKYGYDCRGVLRLRWLEAKDNHAKALESIATYGQLTVWLEHFTKAARGSFEDLYHAVEHAAEGISTELPHASWELNKRQQHILTLLENPTAKVTNRDVQHLFHISQVTASRDLTHLTTLGLLYPHGKGRSVSYIKA